MDFGDKLLTQPSRHTLAPPPRPGFTPPLTKARVICPITDPYVVHHGALGGFVTVYLPEDADVSQIVMRLAAVEGIECAVTREEGGIRFELPEDRVGDVLVISTMSKVLGSSPDAHDLSGLTEPLRSHGALSEAAQL